MGVCVCVWVCSVLCVQRRRVQRRHVQRARADARAAPWPTPGPRRRVAAPLLRPLLRCSLPLLCCCWGQCEGGRGPLRGVAPLRSGPRAALRARALRARTLKSFFTTTWSRNCSAWPPAPGEDTSSAMGARAGRRRGRAGGAGASCEASFPPAGPDAASSPVAKCSENLSTSSTEHHSSAGPVPRPRGVTRSVPAARPSAAPSSSHDRNSCRFMLLSRPRKRGASSPGARSCASASSCKLCRPRPRLQERALFCCGHQARV